MEAQTCRGSKADTILGLVETIGAQQHKHILLASSQAENALLVSIRQRDGLAPGRCVGIQSTSQRNGNFLYVVRPVNLHQIIGCAATRFSWILNPPLPLNENLITLCCYFFFFLSPPQPLLYTFRSHLWAGQLAAAFLAAPTRKQHQGCLDCSCL